MIGSALLAKCGENVTFIKEDIERALNNLVDQMPQSKTVLTLVTGGAQSVPPSFSRSPTNTLPLSLSLQS